MASQSSGDRPRDRKMRFRVRDRKNQKTVFHQKTVRHFNHQIIQPARVQSSNKPTSRVGMPFWSYLDRYGWIWTKFQLKPSILHPNRAIHVNYAHWGGGPLALSLGCCQELRQEMRLLVQPARDRLSKDFLLKDCLLKCQITIFPKTVPRRLEIIHISFVQRSVNYMGSHAAQGPRGKSRLIVTNTSYLKKKRHKGSTTRKSRETTSMFMVLYFEYGLFLLLSGHNFKSRS